MAARAMKIKVRVDALVEKVEAAKAAATAEYQAELAEYEASLAPWKAAQIEALQAALADVRKGRLLDADSRYRNGHYVGYLAVPFDKDDRPDKPRLDTKGFDRHLSLLRACADDTLSISTDDDLGRYL